MPYGQLADALKSAYIDAAYKEHKGSRKPTDSEIQAVTGISRKLIPKIVIEDTDSGYTPLGHILGGWVVDPGFHLGGKPAELPIKAIGAPSFTSLVKKYARDLGHKPVLEQLKLAGAVEVTDYGTVRLISSSYVASQDTLNDISSMSTSLAHHFETMLTNIKIKHEGGDQEGRMTDKKRFSHYIPMEQEKEVTALIRRELLRTERTIEQILDAREVSPDRYDLMLVGAGVYMFKSKNEG